MSKDGSAFTDYQTISGLNNGDAGTYTITGLEAGDYQFRFANDDYLLDNFEGFKLNLADHIISIAASTIPESKSWDMTMKEGRSFEATVTVKEMRGVAEEVTAKFYMGNEVIGTATGSVAANGTETLTITATPTASATDGIEMHIEVEYAGGTVSTDPVTRYVAALTYYTLDENSSDEVWSGTYDFVTLKRTFAAGWNTVCLPFTISEAGNYVIRFEDATTGGGLHEFLLLDCEVTCVSTPDAIRIVSADGTESTTIRGSGIYGLGGERRRSLQPGFNIIRTPDGGTKKVMVR